MLIIFGIGNDKKNLLKTRHNAGFIFIDSINHINHDNQLKLYKNSGYNINSAGEYLIQYIKEYNNLWVAHDDLETEIGCIKWSYGITSKGHNGLKNIISKIGCNFGHIRIGIGRPVNDYPVKDYVLEIETNPLFYQSIDFSANLCINNIDLLKSNNIEALRKLCK